MAADNQAAQEPLIINSHLDKTSTHPSRPKGQQYSSSFVSEIHQRRRPSPNDIQMLIRSGALIGSQRVSNHMAPYVFGRDAMVNLLKSQYERDKNHYEQSIKSGKRAVMPQAAQLDTLESTFDLRHTWNQLNLAAMLLAGVKRPENILVVASNTRAANGAKYLAMILGSKVTTGRYVPGTITNTNQETFCEPPFIILASATEDTQAIHESSKSNSPIIAFADSTSNLEHVDVPIPCNTSGRLSIGLMMYLLARQIQRHRGIISYSSELQDLTPDHFVQQKTSKKDIPPPQTTSSSNQQQISSDFDHNTKRIPENAQIFNDQQHQHHHGFISNDNYLDQNLREDNQLWQ